MDYNQTTLDSDMNTALELTTTSKAFLYEATKWARFIAIVGFVFIGLIVLIALVMALALSAMPLPGLGVSGGFIALFYMILAAVYFFPVLYLFRFGTKTQDALERMDSIELENGIKNLKANFKFVGIMLIVSIVLYILIIILAIFTSTAGLFS